MTLPTFLGIGAPRAGSTWLHELLDSHPDIYVPFRRKEVRFFDRYFERGYHWYEKFFPSDERAGRFAAIGEITPTYLPCAQCPERIASVPSITQLIVILRNPVDRAYSSYGFNLRYKNYSGSFKALLSLRPQIIQWGFYSQYLGNYFRSFRRDQILVLIFEHAVVDVPDTKEILASFLGVSADRFPSSAGTKRVHESYIPAARFGYAMAMKMVQRLYERDLDWVVNLARGLGINARLFGVRGSPPPITAEDRDYLSALYEDEIKELESLLQVDLACWK